MTTIAGGGNTDVGDDPVPGAQARLSGNKLTTAPDGSLYVSGSSAIVRISSGGSVRHLAGSNTVFSSTGDGGSSRSASFSRASGVAFAPSGSVYLTDTGSIRRIAPNGIIEKLAPADTANDSGFNSSSIVVDASENTYIGVRNRITTFDANGHALTFAGGGQNFGDNVPATSAALSSVGDLSMGADGNIYFIDFRQIKRVTPPLPGLSAGNMLIASEDGSQVYVFDENGRHLKTVDSETGVVIHLFGYDANGRLESVTDPDGNVTSILRDPDGKPFALVAPGGQQTALTIGSDGYLSRATNAAGEATALTYDAGGLLETLTDPRGGLHQFTYSADGRLIKDQDPAGGFTALSRIGTDQSFNVSRSSGEGRSMSYHYATGNDGSLSRSVTDSAGLTATSSRLSNRTGTSHAPDGTSTTSTEMPDPRFGGQVFLTSGTFQTPQLFSSYSSDRSAVLTNLRDPLSVSSVTEHLRLNGRTYTRAFAASTRRTTLTTPMGRTTSMTRDSKDHVTAVSPAGLAATGFSYDARGLLATLQTGSRQTQFIYDGHRRLQSVTDPLQRTVTFGYDTADRVTDQTLPDGRQIHFAYDQNGNLTSVTPPSRPHHLFSYTSTDLTSSYTPPAVPNGGATQYAYNRDKQLTLVTRPDSRTVGLTYDGAGRMAALTIGSGTYQYAYEATTGNLASITAPDGGVTQFAYDGSLLTDATWTGAVSGSMHWDYDSDMVVTGETVNCPTAVTLACNGVSFSYDDDKLLVRAGDLALSRAADSGLLSGSTIGNLTVAWTYNSFGEPLTYAASYGGTALFDQQYTRDDVGRIAQKSETVDGVTSQYSYGYDTSGRLIDVSKNGANTSHYTYDDNGNRLSRTTPAGTENGSYDAQDRVLSYNAASYTQSAAGDLVTKVDSTGTSTYKYDELGNLNHVMLPDGRAIDYVIDGQNRRIGKKVDGAFAQRFLYAGNLSPAAEVDANGDVVARFIYAMHANVPDLIIKGDVTYRVITDHLGSPRLVLKADDGSVVQRMDFDEFGNVLTDTNPGFQPFGFAGGMYDADTKLISFGSRDYDSSTGRWTAKDPIGFEGGDSDLYAYAGSDPVNFIDPLGT
ncbi:MAG: RHS repeat-associated core domain-containing protein, partial [Thermoanaerobaculia bacterium]